MNTTAEVFGRLPEDEKYRLASEAMEKTSGKFRRDLERDAENRTLSSKIVNLTFILATTAGAIALLLESSNSLPSSMQMDNVTKPLIAIATAVYGTILALRKLKGWGIRRLIHQAASSHPLMTEVALQQVLDDCPHLEPEIHEMAKRYALLPNTLEERSSEFQAK